jgi:hypothetical protein
MIQLKVYSNTEKLLTEQYFLDLYETEPIKLTLSIEDITNADATSTYSKAFKVPGTRANAEFFKNVFDVDATLYDVTIKKPAEILVDGVEFKQGHVRLQRIFMNSVLDRYDYELLFLGETRDFSSLIGEAGLCELDLPELVGNALNNNIDAASVVASWQAYPETTSLTAGLHNGNIIYPLIDHGNSYNSAGTVQETRIALNNAGPHFTKSNNPLNIDRMKPMIRAKRLVDQIFTDVGYTYSSVFLESDLFHQIYISAFGNEANVIYESNGSSNTSINTAYGDNLVSTQGVTTASSPNPNNGLSFLNNQVDPGNNLGNRTYVVPTATGSYTFVAECFYDGYFENSDYTKTDIPARLTLYNYTRNVVLDQSSPGVNQTLQLTHVQTIQAGFFEQGDQIGLIVIPNSGVDWDIVTNVRFAVTEAPGQYSPASGLECSYKQIDFIKDILTSFRLVLAPDPKDPKNFIIEPWQTYINSGDVYDWSKKLVENKDVVIEPVFFSQSDVIKFDMQAGGDYTNIYHKQAYSENFGYLEFDSGNELLKGKRDVKLIGIAPTEIVQPEGWVPGDNIGIPQLHTHSAEDTGLQHLPLKVKTRMLFYNGLQAFTHPNNTGGPNNVWYLTGAGAQSTYPLVSPYQAWPIQPQTLNLNWANDIQYWQQIAGYNDNGSTLYSDYWSRYISSLYNKYSRRVTAYFVLNNIDLNDFSFDDTIFVNGTYYRPEKILDVEVGAYTEVKVQLLTANDYKPKVVLNEELTGVSATGIPATCENPGIIRIITNGTPQFNWNLSNGMSGTALLGTPSGQAPYTFDIANVTGGTYTVYLTDSVGRTGQVTVQVPLFIPANVTAPYVVINASDCTGTNDGIVDVTPMGGVAPYTIAWQDGNTDFYRTGMTPGVTIPYIVTDANGCVSQTYSPEVGCDNPGLVWYFAENFNCQALSSDFLKVEVYSTPNSSDIVTLNSIATGQDLPGCYSPIYQAQGLPDYVISQYWQDCESCQGITPETGNWRLEACDAIGKPIVINFGVVAPEIGSSHTVAGIIPKCYYVVSETEEEATHILEQSYTDCQTCEAAQSVCRKYEFANESASVIEYNYVNCDGLLQQGTMDPGRSFTDCVRTSPTPQIGQGGTLTDLEPCE